MEDKKTLKVKCFITGEESVFSGDYLKSLEERYGSRENILKYYITFRAKSLLFKGYSIEEIRKILVSKKTEFEDPGSEHGLEVQKYWMDRKNSGKKVKFNESENVSFTKTDEDVKVFIDKWKSEKLLDALETEE